MNKRFMDCKTHTWAEVDLANIAHNIKELRRCLKPSVMFMAVVKANAYGHGAYEVARTALDNGAQWLGVATVREGIELRQKGIYAPILVLGGIVPEEAQRAVAADLTQAVFSIDVAEALSCAAVIQHKIADVHIKIDTGMGRVGVRPDNQLQDLVEGIKRLPGIKVNGIFTHFAESDVADKAFTLHQLRLFIEAIEYVKKAGLDIQFVHAANSAAIMAYEEAHFNMVRGGIAMYGYYPSDEIDKGVVNLKPALSWKAQVVYVKEVAACTPISYGRTFVTQRASKVATIPVGYADGYRRQLSNKGYVLIRGKKAPVIGRVCMDQFMVDVTDIPGVCMGDEVVLIGRQGDEIITADDLALQCNTISYEILTSIGPRVNRIYLNF